jgi:hypothetical protein
MSTRILGLATALLLAACVEPGSIGTSSSATTAVSVATTFPATTVPQTTLSEPLAACPPALVTNDGVVWVVNGDCSVARTTLTSVAESWGRLGSWLVDDLTGGVLYQSDDKTIWLQSPGSDEPVPLASAAEGEQVWLQDVSLSGGQRDVWFTRDRGSTIDDSLETFERVPIGESEPVVIAETGGWESGSTMTVGGVIVASQGFSEGFYTFGIWSTDGGSLDQPWNPYREIPEPFIGCEGCPTDLIVDDRGTRVAYLQPETEEFRPVLVVLDPVSGDDVVRERLADMSCCSGGGGADLHATSIDLFEDNVLVNRADDNRATFAMWKDLSDPDAEWQEFRVRGSARFLRSDLQVGLLED